MKLSKNILLALIILIVAVVSFFVGHQVARDGVPSNCADFGALYLEWGKERFGITDFAGNEWKSLIDKETKLVNDCYKSLK